MDSESLESSSLPSAEEQKVERGFDVATSLSLESVFGRVWELRVRLRGNFGAEKKVGLGDMQRE